MKSAYRKGHSTETALLFVLNYFLLAVDRGDACILALLDQSAAFELIDQLILLKSLSSLFGICGLALRWIASYLYQIHFLGLACSGV